MSPESYRFIQLFCETQSHIKFNLNLAPLPPYCKMMDFKVRFNLNLALIQNGGKRQIKLIVRLNNF